MENIRIFCKNTGEYFNVSPGISLEHVLKITEFKSDYPILAALVDNQLKEMDFNVYMPHSIEFLSISHPDGRRTYNRSLSLVLQKAAYDLFPNYQLILDYALPTGLFGKFVEKPAKELKGGHEEKAILLKPAELEKLKERINHIIESKQPITKVKLSNDEAISLFKGHHQFEKAKLFKSLGKFFVSVYFLDGYGDTFYGPLLINTNKLDKFNITPYDCGFCLQFPEPYAPFNLPPLQSESKLADVFRENSYWCSIIGAKDIGNINFAILNGYGPKVIQIAEALHERKYAAIADKIYQKKDSIKLVLIAGPSSSGKTTTSKRIALQLKVLGLNPVVLAMDNYFVNRENTPKDENGNYDFECLGAMDLKLLNEQLNDLFAGNEVEIPKFNFADGKRFFDGTKLKLHKNDILIMEGIHALNPGLTSKIADSIKFRIYASALTSLSIDENNYISTTDSRLLRRMVRDNNFRGTSAEQTILRWQSVKDGEYKNIFPFQENADIMFNSALIYELPLLKHYADPLLRRIPPTSAAYAESLRLLKFLSYIVELNPKEQKGIPPTSVMREFIGDSTFDY